MFKEIIIVFWDDYIYNKEHLEEKDKNDFIYIVGLLKHLDLSGVKVPVSFEFYEPYVYCGKEKEKYESDIASEIEKTANIKVNVFKRIYIQDPKEGKKEVNLDCDILKRTTNDLVKRISLNDASFYIIFIDEWYTHFDFNIEKPWGLTVWNILYDKVPRNCIYFSKSAADEIYKESDRFHFIIKHLRTPNQVKDAITKIIENFIFGKPNFSPNLQQYEVIMKFHASCIHFKNKNDEKDSHNLRAKRKIKKAPLLIRSIVRYGRVRRSEKWFKNIRKKPEMLFNQLNSKYNLKLPIFETTANEFVFNPNGLRIWVNFEECEKSVKRGIEKINRIFKSMYFREQPHFTAAFHCFKNALSYFDNIDPYDKWVPILSNLGLLWLSIAKKLYGKPALTGSHEEIDLEKIFHYLDSLKVLVDIQMVEKLKKRLSKVEGTNEKLLGDLLNIINLLNKDDEQPQISSPIRLLNALRKYKGKE